MRVKSKCTFASVRFAHLFSQKNPFAVMLFAQRTPYLFTSNGTNINNRGCETLDVR